VVELFPVTLMCERSKPFLNPVDVQPILHRSESSTRA